MSKFDPYAHTNLVLNPDGTVTSTFEFPTTDANPNATPWNPVVSKDVTLNVETKTWVRIYRTTKLPSTISRRLPIVIYFHYGGWVHFNVSDSATHQNCLQISSEILAIVVYMCFCGVCVVFIIKGIWVGYGVFCNLDLDNNFNIYQRVELVDWVV